MGGGVAMNERITFGTHYVCPRCHKIATEHILIGLTRTGARGFCEHCVPAETPSFFEAFAIEAGAYEIAARLEEEDGDNDQC